MLYHVCERRCTSHNWTMPNTLSRWSCVGPRGDVWSFSLWTCRVSISERVSSTFENNHPPMIVYELGAKLASYRTYCTCSSIVAYDLQAENQCMRRLKVLTVRQHCWAARRLFVVVSNYSTLWVIVQFCWVCIHQLGVKCLKWHLFISCKY